LDWFNDCQITSDSKCFTTDWKTIELQQKQKEEQLEYFEPTTKDVSSFESSMSRAEALMLTTQENDMIKIPRRLVEELLMVLDVLGSWCVYRLLVLVLKMLQNAILMMNSPPVDDEMNSGEAFWKQTMLEYVRSKLRMIYAICHKRIGKNRTVDLQHVSPKVHRLLEVLKEYKIQPDPDTTHQKYNDRNESGYVSWWQDSDAEDDDDDDDDNGMKDEEQLSKNYTSPLTNTLCGIVFVQEKPVAMMLQRLLREICKEDSDLKHVCSSHITTTTADNSQQNFDTACMDKNKQEDVLRKFRNRETNLLISTGGLEDCAFIPKCNLVVRFDVPRSYKAYVQSKSRARASTSAYVLLVRESEKQEFLAKLQEYKRIETILQGQTASAVSKGMNQLENGNVESDDEYQESIPPFSLNRNTQATMTNSIRIVNRYCSRLPSDPFTHLSPRCEVMKLPSYFNQQTMYKCILQLPINSRVRQPIEGIEMPSVILAQRAVAMEAVKELHYQRELDDNLMPIGKETVKYAEELDPWKPEKAFSSGRPGSTKRRQTYDKQTPKTLSDCYPTNSSDLFL